MPAKVGIQVVGTTPKTSTVVRSEVIPAKAGSRFGDVRINMDSRLRGNNWASSRATTDKHEMRKEPRQNDESVTG
jgi:hypothetical protein